MCMQWVSGMCETNNKMLSLKSEGNRGVVKTNWKKIVTPQENCKENMMTPAR